jgi:hypothetical protein
VSSLFDKSSTFECVIQVRSKVRGDNPARKSPYGLVDQITGKVALSESRLTLAFKNHM